jgi:hypothetical protein
MVDGTLKLKKYIVMGREEIVHNEDGDDRRRLITEIYILKPNTQIKGGWREYQKYMYNEIQTPTALANGEKCRGRDVNMENAMSYISVDGTAQDFIDFNFKSGSLQTHNIRFIKTYPNQKFLKRERETSAHEEYEYALDEKGNVFRRRVDKNAPQPVAPAVVADFSTIPAGAKYLYTRLGKGTPEECITVTDVGYWLKNDAQNDEMIGALSTSLDNVAPAGWDELTSTSIEPSDGDFDALEKALQADPDWGSDTTFDSLFV